MSALEAMVAARPYVLAFLAGFALLSLSERGPLRTATWLVAGTAIGWLSEFSSVRTGVPFGAYVYHQENFPAELWLGDVPLFASLSFAFLSYFAYSAACSILGRVEGRGAAARRAVDVDRERSVPVMLLAAAIATWMDTVIDPATLLGPHWFLGDLYHYASPGEHLGVPLTNYVGWFVTVGAIVTANQLLDRRIDPGGEGARGLFALPAQAYLGVIACGGVFVFILSVLAWLAIAADLPEGARIGERLGSGVALTAAFGAFAYLGTRPASGAGAGAPRPATAARGPGGVARGAAG